MPEAEFLRRYLQHVLPSGFVRIRSYGLYHHSQKERLARARTLLGTAAPPTPAEDSAENAEAPLCPHCHRPMRYQGALPRGRPLIRFQARAPP